MTKNTPLVLLLIAGATSLIGTAAAQVVSPPQTGLTAPELTQVALGWSVKKGVLGKPVYNDAGEKIGNVDDVIIAPDKRASFLLIGTGGFIGLGGHDVAVSTAQVQNHAGKLEMPGATKEALKAMPAFDYANDTANRYRFVASAEQDVARAKAKLTELDQKAAGMKGDAKLKLDQQIGELQKDLKLAEQKLAELKRAAASQWKGLESDVSAATARLREAL
jgi:hypothetical protein